MALQEEVIIRNAQNGDIEAFEEIVDLYQKLIYNISFKMLGNTDDAMEASQEVFMRIYRSIKKFKFDSKFSTWIYRITTNLCLDIIRKNKVSIVSIDKNVQTNDGEMIREFPDDVHSVEDTVLRSEKIEIVRKTILLLKPEYRTVVILRDIQGLSYTEISELLEVPEGTVKSRINRGRNELKNILEEKTELFSKHSVKISEGRRSND